MIKKFFLHQSSFFLFNQAVLNAVTYNSEPKIFVEELVQDAIKTLSDKSIPEEEKNLIIEKIKKRERRYKRIGTLYFGKYTENVRSKYNFKISRII